MFVNNRNGNIVPPTAAYIREAADILKGGGLVAFPTETVYGLGANALDPEAVARIFAAKGRPQDNPLILHVSGISDAAKYGELNRVSETLMHAFWPGALTIVVGARPVVPEVTRAGLDTVALRAPLHPVAMELIRESGMPIAAPSANRSGRPSTTTAGAVADDLGGAVDLILDAGPTRIGLESTVVDATECEVAVLRPGGVTQEMLAQYVDIAEDDETLKYRSPGNLHRHYAPTVPVLLWNAEGGDDDLFAALGAGEWSYLGLVAPPATTRPPCEKVLFRSPEEYARELFACFRRLETSGARTIVAQLPPDCGMGRALRNRLQKASGSGAS